MNKTILFQGFLFIGISLSTFSMYAQQMTGMKMDSSTTMDKGTAETVDQMMLPMSF